MIQLLLVMAMLVGVGAFYLHGGGGGLGSVASSTPPTEVVAQVEAKLGAIASSQKSRTAQVSEQPEQEPFKESGATFDEFPVLYPMTIGTVAVNASVATSLPDRVRGLSGTKRLPAGIVKLFVFDSDGPQSIWMKDMNYPIDIVWLDAAGQVVHIAPRTEPNTYPKSFSSPVPARYVVEAEAGFVAANGIGTGTVATLPLLQ